MPLYEYRCEACGSKEERLESLSAPEQHDCPDCEAPLGMKRQLSVAAFALAGSGWYKEGYSAAAKAPEAPAPATGGCCAGSCACAAKSS